MKKNETNATEVMKFFREQREAKQLKATDVINVAKELYEFVNEK